MFSPQLRSHLESDPEVSIVANIISGNSIVLNEFLGMTISSCNLTTQEGIQDTIIVFQVTFDVR